jgi:hypothetical protein
MTIRKIEIERLSVTSSKPFEAVVAALEAAIGHPDMAQFAKGTEGARTFAELESTVDRALGRTGLMLFEARCRCGSAQGDRARHAENRALSDRQSTHHEGNGEARSRRRFLCPRHGARGRAVRRCACII